MICAHCKNYKKGYCSVKHKEVGYLQKFPCFEAVVEDDVVLLPEEEMNNPIFDTTKQMETKVCKTCGRELPIEDFATYKGAPTSICKDCRKKLSSEAGKKSREMVKTETTSKVERLTWEDIQTIVEIADSVIEDTAKKDLLSMGQPGYYTIILNKWRDLRNESAE